VTRDSLAHQLIGVDSDYLACVLIDGEDGAAQAVRLLALGANLLPQPPRPDGTPLSHKAADWTLARAVKRAGLERFSWHDLRHSHVSRLFAAGLDPVAIAARVGDALEVVLTTYGSAMEASGGSKGQQTTSEAPANVALHRAIGDGGQ